MDRPLAARRCLPVRPIAAQLSAPLDSGAMQYDGWQRLNSRRLPRRLRCEYDRGQGRLVRREEDSHAAGHHAARRVVSAELRHAAWMADTVMGQVASARCLRPQREQAAGLCVGLLLCAARYVRRQELLWSSVGRSVRQQGSTVEGSRRFPARGGGAGYRPGQRNAQLCAGNVGPPESARDLLHRPGRRPTVLSQRAGARELSRPHALHPTDRPHDDHAVAGARPESDGGRAGNLRIPLCRISLAAMRAYLTLTEALTASRLVASAAEIAVTRKPLLVPDGAFVAAVTTKWMYWLLPAATLESV